MLNQNETMRIVVRLVLISVGTLLAALAYQALVNAPLLMSSVSWNWGVA